MAQALRAHRALSCSGYFPYRLHHLGQGTSYLETNYPAGTDGGLALSQGAEGAGDRIRGFPARPDRFGRKAQTGSGFDRGAKA